MYTDIASLTLEFDFFCKIIGDIENNTIYFRFFVLLYTNYIIKYITLLFYESPLRERNIPH